VGCVREIGFGLVGVVVFGMSITSSAVLQRRVTVSAFRNRVDPAF
jgi:hypothetical protein